MAVRVIPDCIARAGPRRHSDVLAGLIVGLRAQGLDASMPPSWRIDPLEAGLIAAETSAPPVCPGRRYFK